MTMAAGVRGIQKIAGGIPAINIPAGITPAGAVGVAIVLVVAADPIGFRDMIGVTINRIIDARYSVVVDASRKVVEVRPGM